MRNAKTDRKTADALARGLDTAKARGASAAKIDLSQRERIGCSFEAGRLKGAETTQSVSYTVTVLIDGRKGSATGTDLGDLDEMISRAVELAKAGSAAHFDAYPPAGEVTPVKTWSENVLALPRERLIDGCRHVVDALKGYDADLYIEAGGRRSESERLLVTTGGVRHASVSTGWSLNAYAQRTEGTDMLFAGFGRGWGELNGLFDPAYIASRILEDLRSGERIAEPPTGPCAAMLSPELLETLLYAVRMGVDGRNVAKGDSPLRGRLSEKAFDDKLTLIDDPHLDYCPGAAEIDSDGVPTRKLPIVTNGVLKHFLYDLDSAGLAGAEPTGNDRCQPHSLEVLPGRRSHEELLAGLDDGILVKGLLGFGQGNLINGDFSCNVGLGFRVRRGRIVGRIKNTMAAGNVYELLAAGLELSSDRDPVRRMPWAVVQGLHCAAARN
jgi:PmbA protein